LVGSSSIPFLNESKAALSEGMQPPPPWECCAATVLKSVRRMSEGIIVGFMPQEQQRNDAAEAYVGHSILID
jgi:hypothetical protein